MIMVINVYDFQNFNGSYVYIIYHCQSTGNAGSTITKHIYSISIQCN